MTTLAEINQTLLQQVELMTEQGKSIQKTSDSIAAVKKSIANVLIQQRSDRLDEIETKREAKKKQEVITRPSGFLQGFSQGTGFSWLSDFFGSVFRSLLGTGGSLLGKLTGFIGLAAGKLLVWGTIGGLIANFFGDEIKAFAEKFKEITGIDIDAELEKTGYKEEILVAATLALGALTKGVAKALTKIAGRALFALGSAGLGMLGFGPKEAPTAPKQSTTGRKPTGKSSKIPTTSSKAVTAAQRAALANIAPESLPKGFVRNAAGQIVDAATGKYAKASDVVAAIEKAGKFAKYGKLIRFLGAAGAVIPALVDPAYAIYTEQSPEVVRKELIGALGSVSGAYLGGLVGGAAGGAAGTAVPGIGNAVLGFGGALVGGIAGAVAGETIAEELANFLLGDTPAKGKPAMAPNRLEAYRMAREAAGARPTTSPYEGNTPAGMDPISVQGRINAFQAYGVDRDRQRMSATERGISRTPPTTASNLTQAAANARISAIINNAPVINNITNNNGGGGNTSVMTVPVGTADVSDRRDIIRRYGR